MTTGMLLRLVAILAMAITGPTLAQPARTGSLADPTANAMAQIPPLHPWQRVRETATRPWSAPIGHRQPRATDVSAATREPPLTLDDEDAEVDRKISGICRGC